MSNPILMRNEIVGRKTAENMNKRGFEACYVETAAEAKEKALSYIGTDDVIGWGGSKSAEECGLMDEIRSGKYPNIIDREDVKDRAEALEKMRQSLLADVYIGGANALTKDGQIVNIDGNGNRVAAMTFGPKSVIVIASVDKIAENVEAACVRARQIAAPTNVQRLNRETPCMKTGECADCQSPNGICNYFQVIRRCNPAGKIKVILVGEKLGF